MTAGYTRFLSHAEAFFRLSVVRKHNATEDFSSCRKISPDSRVHSSLL